jgi:dTDP-4-amino-4,6-dideoxygalactose transaminase
MSVARPLALLDSTVPAFPELLHVGRPNVGDRTRLMARISDLLDRRWLTNDGRYVRELEATIAARAGVEHCVAVCNATMALDLALRALNLRGEVLVPAFTFVATAHAVAWAGLQPVLCDVSAHTHNIDPSSVEAKAGANTTAIVAVHLWGRPAPVEALASIAQRRNLRLIYDAAHAFGATCAGRPIGGFGDCEIFSFHATKFINSFEGGAIVTRNAELAARLRLMRNFGFAGYDNVVTLGTNAKMCEPVAAMALTSMEAFDEFVATNRRNHAAYSRALCDVPGVRILRYDERERNNWQYVVLEIDGETALDRDLLMQVLHAENVFARRYFYPGIHRMHPYQTISRDAAGGLPITESLAARVLCLPTGTSVSVANIEVIGDIVRTAVRRRHEVITRSAAR